MKNIRHTKQKVDGLIERGFADFRVADRLFEPGSEDMFNAYIDECERKEIEAIRMQIKEADKELAEMLQAAGIGRKAVFAICRDSPSKEAAMASIKEAREFFTGYGLTIQANQAWKEYWP